MKKVISLAICFLFLSSAFAQSPQAIPYQAIIRNNDGSVMSNTALTLTFKIHDSSATGTIVYEETHSNSSNSQGLVSVNVGGGSPVSGTFSTINWSSGPKYLHVLMNTGNGDVDLGTQQLLSVPYALYAENSNNGFNHYIGEEFGGGVVFHIWKDAQNIEHGLIVDKADLSSGGQWSNVTNSQIGVNAQSSWDGLNNSLAIIAQNGHITSAASLCLNSTNSGFSDWYLPSIDEFKLLWQSRFNVNKTLSLLAGGTQLPNSANYWTSTENSADRAWHYYGYIGYGFDNNFYGNYLKSTNNYIRAIRSF
jgi:hypothetical protein